MKTAKFIYFFVLLISMSGFSQTSQQFIDSGSVKNQFDYMIDKSNRYQEYKVVRMTWLQKLKSNTLDSLTAYNIKITDDKNLINNQITRIDSLNLALENSKNEIVSLQGKIQSISLFGIQFKKPVFKVIGFSIIGVLLLLLVVFISRFKVSNRQTLQTKETLKEVEEEYENHRKIALEREQKVRRQLQDELNKQKKD